VVLMVVMAVALTALITLLVVGGDDGDGEAGTTSTTLAEAAEQTTTSTTVAETTTSTSSTTTTTTTTTVPSDPADEPDEPDEPESDPEEGPANLTASFDGERVTLRWDDAVGEAGYSYEIGVYSDFAGSGSVGTLPADATRHVDNAGCGRRVVFTLIAERGDGSEIGRVSDEFNSPACS
jgi:hypothetical protein